MNLHVHSRPAPFQSQPRDRRAFTLAEMMVAMGISALIMGGAATFINMAAISMSGTVSQTMLSYRTSSASEFIFSRVRFASGLDNGGDTSGKTLRLLIQDVPPVDTNGNLIDPAQAEDDHDHHHHYNDGGHGYRYDDGHRAGFTDDIGGWHDDDDRNDNNSGHHHGHSDEHGHWHDDGDGTEPTTVVQSSDAGVYHYELFQLQSYTTTNSSTVLTNSRLIYVASENLPEPVTLIGSGVRGLPGKPVFAITNVATALVSFAVVDGYVQDFYQACDVQGAVVARNRSSSTNVVNALP